jgi:DNA-binding NarL/FixJ family response regulator
MWASTSRGGESQLTSVAHTHLGCRQAKQEPNNNCFVQARNTQFPLHWRDCVNRPRVLLADDHRALLERTTALLSSSYEIVGAVSNGQELVTEAIRLNPDVIVLDITMPFMDGIEAARKLREIGLSSKLVFLTIHNEDEFVKACLDEGGQGYVLKAHMKTHLVRAIEAALMGCTFISSAHAHRTDPENYPFA